MGIAAADHNGIGLAGRIDVVGITALAAQQGRVLDPQNRLADAEFLKRQAAFVDHAVHGFCPQKPSLFGFR